MTTKNTDLQPSDIVRVNRFGYGLQGVLAQVQEVLQGGIVAVRYATEADEERIVHLWAHKLDFVARPEKDPNVYQQGDAFPNVAYVRRFLGVERVEAAA